VRRFRPDLVVSTGAGVALPFFALAKLFRIPTVYVEVYDRIATRTLTGRLCRPLSDLFLVQWPEQVGLYRGAQLVGRLL
jgi:UDP-N-acetylglucosamine:LPS N-acetylglucosamine transferase